MSSARATDLPDAGAVLAIGVALIIQIIGVQTVEASGSDTPSLPYVNGSAGNGDCWQPTTPLMCRTAWPGRNQLIYFRAIDQFSSQRPGWRTDANNAVNAWNNAPGPQLYSFTNHTGAKPIYLNYDFSGDHDLNDLIDAITWNCNASHYCDDTGTTPMAIAWTDVYMNSTILDFVPIDHAKIQEAFGHESGHGMGLAHNFTDPSALMYYKVNHVGAPNAHDTGLYPGCASGGHGVICIYGWGD
jgi:hypothetical protein